MIAVTNLSIGGAQTFVVRLAGELVKKHDIYLYNFNLFTEDDTTIVHRLPESIKIISIRKDYFPLRLALWLDQHLNKLGCKTNFTEELRCYFFRNSVRRYRIDLVNSHLFHSDYIATKSLASVPVPIVMVDHGDYRFILQNHIANSFMIARIFQRVDAIVYISESNFEVIRRNSIHAKTILRKIYNGFAIPRIRASSPDIRRELGIGDDAVVFGMVARGIPEKGWKETLEAFQKIQLLVGKQLHLVLVGSSDYLSDLQSSLASGLRSRVHFVGYSVHPEYWVNSFDVALLPTYFPGESLPNSVIEYLALGKPVIATSIGGIPEMLDVQGQLAGVLVDLDEQGRINVDILANAMRVYAQDEEKLKHDADLAWLAFEKFNLKSCVKEYENLFQQLVEKSTCSRRVL
jgi:glycosyltransferase involved in cell wall biosynthesis